MRTRLALLAWAAMWMQPAFAGQITSYETAGNLKPTHKLDCITVDQIENEYTPADMMVAFDKCIESERYDDAMTLFNVAGTYSRFDELRVSDATARDAFQALMAEHPVVEPHRSKMYAIFQRYQADGSPEKAKLCAELKHLGPPNYRPDYMISHGMGAFLGTGGMVQDFDAKKGWKNSLDRYMHCDVTDMN